MKKYEKKQVTREESNLVDTICDICGMSINDRSKWPEYAEKDQCETKNEVVMSHDMTAYSIYPEGGGEYKKIEIDCCPACWGEMILPYMESIGLKVRYKEDWW